MDKNYYIEQATTNLINVHKKIRKILSDFNRKQLLFDHQMYYKLLNIIAKNRKLGLYQSSVFDKMFFNYYIIIEEVFHVNNMNNQYPELIKLGIYYGYELRKYNIVNIYKLKNYYKFGSNGTIKNQVTVLEYNDLRKANSLIYSACRRISLSSIKLNKPNTILMYKNLQNIIERYKHYENHSILPLYGNIMLFKNWIIEFDLDKLDIFNRIAIRLKN